MKFKLHKLTNKKRCFCAIIFYKIRWYIIFLTFEKKNNMETAERHKINKETNNLQKTIIQKVLQMNDKHLLEELNLLLTKNDHQETNQSSYSEKPIITDSQANYLAGIPNEVLFYQNTKWMSE